MVSGTTLGGMVCPIGYLTGKTSIGIRLIPLFINIRQKSKKVNVLPQFYTGMGKACAGGDFAGGRRHRVEDGLCYPQELFPQSMRTDKVDPLTKLIAISCRSWLYLPSLSSTDFATLSWSYTTKSWPPVAPTSVVEQWDWPSSPKSLPKGLSTR